MTPEELRKRLGANIERLMAERGLDEHAVAVKLGWTEPTVAHGASRLRRYLRGEKWPRDATLVQLAEVLGVDPGLMLAK